jgi:hypothetical protein
MDTVELFQRLSIALAIGLLIGLERGWQAREDTGRANVRLDCEPMPWLLSSEPFGAPSPIKPALVAQSR